MNPFLLTTAYFPPIAYFSCLKKAEVTYIEQYETSENRVTVTVVKS